MLNNTDLPDGVGDSLLIPMQTSLDSTDELDVDALLEKAYIASRRAGETIPEIWEPYVLAALKARGYYSTPRIPVTLRQRVRDWLRSVTPHVKVWFGPDEPGLYEEDD